MRVRDFNTEGPVDPSIHYCIPPLERVDRDEILHLVRRRKYFVLHAPRQTGKTSTLKALADTLNAPGGYLCVYANFEVGQTAREDVPEAMRVLLGQIAERAEVMLQDTFVRDVRLNVLDEHGGHGALNVTLARWARAREKPLVLLIDEIDTLEGDSLISVLRQLRAGCDQRPDGFPQSVILCGVRDVRDVRDYRIFSSYQRTNVSGGSAFNIKAESLRLGDFTEDEVQALLGQHTAETGQEFEAGAVERIWELTLGQPWLVNALALQACFKDRVGRDRSRPVGVPAIDRARETLILKRVTHLDQLAHQLREKRVRRVVMPMLAGSVDWEYSLRDLEYVRNLGLVAAEGRVRMANPIYAEVIPRELTAAQESGLESLVSPSWYVDEDGRLDLPKLLGAFQGYFREHSESWVQRYGHREAGPQLVLHAYLHRVVNSGGRITREYAVARGRTDLLVEWPRPGEPLASLPVRHVIECKVVRKRSSLESVIRQGREQTARYMDHCGAESGRLVVFDMRTEKSWEERVFRRDPRPGSPPITVWGS
ncbi:MAG: ATP-binding protein [Bryobacterales bacterium]|nr:ATP-binding protein [Bryobacterales bacterium]